MEEVYTPLTAPGLGADPSYVHGSALPLFIGVVRLATLDRVATMASRFTNTFILLRRSVSNGSISTAQHLPIYRDTGGVTSRPRANDARRRSYPQTS